MHIQSKVIADDFRSLQEGLESINKDTNSPLKIEKNEGRLAIPPANILGN